MDCMWSSLKCWLLQAFFSHEIQMSSYAHLLRESLKYLTRSQYCELRCWRTQKFRINDNPGRSFVLNTCIPPIILPVLRFKCLRTVSVMTWNRDHFQGSIMVTRPRGRIPNPGIRTLVLLCTCAQVVKVGCVPRVALEGSNISAPVPFIAAANEDCVAVFSLCSI